MAVINNTYIVEISSFKIALLSCFSAFVSYKIYLDHSVFIAKDISKLFVEMAPSQIFAKIEGISYKKIE